jgi:hypothetical protein
MLLILTDIAAESTIDTGFPRRIQGPPALFDAPRLPMFDTSLIVQRTPPGRSLWTFGLVDFWNLLS